MSAIVKQGPAVGELELAPRGVMGIIERLASDPNFDTAKLEKLIELHERSEDRAAKGEFNRAMSAAQQEMRPIAADAVNPQTRSRYASYAALDRVLRPIYTAHGFGLSFNTGDASTPEHIRVICIVSHAAGHSEPYRVDMPSDGKGAKGGDVMTKTHAAGAAMSYGMRYLLKMIFNVAVGEDDTDGNDVREAVKDPKGFAEWFADMSALADEGLAAVKAAWKASNAAYRLHATKYHAAEWDAIKAKAEKVVVP